MSITRTQIAKWADKECRLHAPTGDRPARESEMASRMLCEPNLVRHLAGTRLNELIWTLGWMIGLTHGRPLTEHRRAMVVAAVKAAPDFFAYCYRNAEVDSDGLNMFWDIAVNRSSERDPEVKDALFEALSRQLEIPNKFIQASALHGFGHLKDVRCRPLIEAFLKSCDDPQLAEYAGQAMKFEVL